jgi:protein phosphatase
VINQIEDDEDITTPQPNENKASTRLYLGARYQRIGLDIKALSASTTLLKVLDSLPNQPSPLEALMQQQPVDPDPARLGQAPTTFPEWELWERGGVSAEARPYLALKPLLKDHIPQLHDAWHRNGQAVLIIEAIDDESSLQSHCPTALLPQLTDWCHTLLQLWVYLEPWSVRLSLLELDNLYIDQNQQIYLQRLTPETPESTLLLGDLINFWLKFLPASPLSESLEILTKEEANLTVEGLKQHLQQVRSQIDSTNALYQAPITLALEAAAATDVGQQRDHNEDFYSIETNCRRRQSPDGINNEHRGLYILCDGMGGHAAGEVASAMASQKLQEYWAENWQETLPSEEEIEQSILFANQALFEINQTNAAAGNSRMGTTLVMVMVQDNQIAIAHVGDSRCYILEVNSSPVQITLDHEVGQREILRGVEPEIAYGRNDSYQLTQAIGPRDASSIAPEVQFFGLREDTLILIASDGLTDRDLVELHGEELLRPMVKREISLSAGVNQLVEFANGYNGHDNITAIAILVSIGK